MGANEQFTAVGRFRNGTLLGSVRLRAIFAAVLFVEPSFARQIEYWMGPARIKRIKNPVNIEHKTIVG